MKFLFAALIVILASLACNSGQIPQIDFCRIDITNNLDGRAYPIDNLPEMVGTVFKEEFESQLKEEHFIEVFLQTFGSPIQNITNWHYDFEKLGRVDVNRILPESLHCLFFYEREYFPNVYRKPTLDTNSIVSYLVNEVFGHALEEGPINVRLPLIVFDKQNALGCNFGTMFSSGEEYFVLHCVHNIMDSATSRTTTIENKSTNLAMCVSNVDEICVIPSPIDMRSN